MELKQYEGKRVKILSVNNNIYEGYVGDYCYPEDDDNNLEMIIVDVIKGNNVGSPVGFYEKDIKSIEVIELMVV